MRLRIAILLSLLVIGGLLAGIQPVSASGPWAVELTIACQAKRDGGTDPGLRFVTLSGSQNSSYSVLCGKPHSGVHNKHNFQLGATSGNIPNVCIAEEADALGKKPDPKMPRMGTLPNTPGLANTQFVANCLILALANATGNCGFSSGTLGGAVHTKDANGVWKLVFFSGSWLLAPGGTLPITGTAGKVLALLRLSTGGPFAFAAVVNAQPDLPHKNDSCITGDGKAQNFLFQGEAVVATTAK